jgi:hypothetical protein
MLARKYFYRTLLSVWLFVWVTAAFTEIGVQTTCEPFSKWIVVEIIVIFGITSLLGFLAGAEWEQHV